MQETVGKIGFIFSSVIYLLLTILVFFTDAKSSKKKLLVVTMLAMSLCSIATSFFLEFNNNYNYFLSIESIRNICIIFILFDILTYSSSKNAKTPYRKDISLIISLLIGLELLTLIFLKGQTTLLLLHLSQTIFILFLIEQLIRRTPKTHKHKIKSFCIGYGLLYTYDFAFFADALLTKSIDNNMLYIRGWISIAMAPFIIFALRKIQIWSVRIYISRDIVFNSTLLFVAGFYLLLMSAMGYFINLFNYSWNGFAQDIFFALSAILFASLFLSDSLRTNLKLFIVKHFYENKYDYRDEWIRFSESLENKIETPYSVALSSITKPLNCKKGILFEYKPDKLEIKAKFNIKEISQLDLITQLAKKSIEHKIIIDLDDLNNNRLPFQIDSKSMHQACELKYIIPIIEPGNVQFVCMLPKINNSNKLDTEDKDLLSALSKHLSIFLELHITNKYIIENQQFIAFNQMSTFLIHDLKNVLAQLNLISKNSIKFKNNVDFIEDTFITIASASARLDKVLSHLLKHKSQEFSNEPVDICNIIIKAFDERKQFKPRLFIDNYFNQAVFVLGDSEKLTNILLNLIKNAQDACDLEGDVKISRLYKEGFFGFCIDDNGEGMTEEFIQNRLFKPFDTTKGNAGLGVGAYDAKKFIEQIGGHINVTSEKNMGSRFEIFIPLSSQVDTSRNLDLKQSAPSPTIYEIDGKP